MPASRVEKVLRSIAKRLTTIRGPSFNTDAGLRVFIGRRSFAKAECPCISVFLSSESPSQSGTDGGAAGGSDTASSKNRIQISVEFHVAFDAQATAISGVIGVHANGSGIDLQKLSADVKVAAFSPARLVDQEVIGAVATDTPLGAIYWLGTQYEPVGEGSFTESGVMSLQVTVTEAFGDPTVSSKPNP